MLRMQYLELILILLGFLVIGDCAVDLQCTEVCLQDVAKYSCIIDGIIDDTIDDTTLRWSVPNLNDLEGLPHILDITTFQQQLSDPTNTFTAVLTDASNNDQLNSTLSFITTNQLNNKQIKCRDGSNISTERTCSIMILGTPSVPLNISVTAVGPNTVVVSWYPPLDSSQCIDHYVVSIDNGNNKNTNSTTLVIDQLIQGMNYSFSVTGVDNAGRTGEESETARITLDVPESVMDLNFILTDESLNITWNAPSYSFRPPVIDYHVYHNITSSDGSLVHNVTNNMTHITFTSVSRGRQYIVNVSAENIIGIGEESLINVYIPISSTSTISSSMSSIIPHNTRTALSSVIPDTTATDVSLQSTTNIFSTTLSGNIQSSYTTSKTTNQITTSNSVMEITSVSSSSIPEEGTADSPKSTSPLVPVVASVFGIILALLAVFVCVVMIVVYRRRSGKYKSTGIKELSCNKGDRNLTSEPGFNSNGMDHTESSLGPTYAAVINKPQPTSLSQYDEVPPPVPPYNYNDEPPKIPPYMGGDEPPPLKPSGGEYSMLQREERNQKAKKPENIPPGLYSTINQRKDEPFVLEPSGKEYSVLKRSEREQRVRETNAQIESGGSGQYSVLNQNVGNKKTGTGGIIYADLGAPPKNRPIIPPPSGFSEPVVYSSITKPPPVPKRLSQKKKDMIYAQLQLELPPSVTPPPPPSVNIQQEKVIYSSVNKQL